MLGRARPCQANHCRWAAEPHRLMCITHWRLLPGDLQGNVLEAWRANHTQARRLVDLRYLEAAAAAIEYIAIKEGHLERNVYRQLANQVRNQEIKTCL